MHFRLSPFDWRAKQPSVSLSLILPLWEQLPFAVFLRVSPFWSWTHFGLPSSVIQISRGPSDCGFELCPESNWFTQTSSLRRYWVDFLALKLLGLPEIFQRTTFAPWLAQPFLDFPWRQRRVSRFHSGVCPRLSSAFLECREVWGKKTFWNLLRGVV